MTNEFCTQTARKLRKLGYAPQDAAQYSRFFFLSMLSVSGVVLAGMRRRKGVKILGDETPRSLLHTLARLVALVKTYGAGIFIAGPAAVDIVPASSRIHRH